MKRITNTVLTVVVLALLGGGAYLVLRQPAEGISIPSLSPRAGNASLSSEFLNAQKSVDFYREEIQKHPDVLKNYIELAQLFQQEARVTGRHHEYIPKAQYLLGEVLSRDPENFEATITRASILMTMHQFAQAKELVERAIKSNSHSAMAFGILCDAQVELGEYDQAVKSCESMMSLRPDTRSYARASYLRELHGDLAGAREAMKLAADAGASGEENRAWALYNLGKLYLNEGNLDTAAFIFKGILEERPEYAYALSGLAGVSRARGNVKEAVELLSKASEITPEHIFLEQLADLYLSAGQAPSAGGVSKIVLNAFAQHEKDGWNIDREYAMFCANHGVNLQESLERIKKEYAVRPENIDVLETYAWVLYNNGRMRDAIPYVERAMRLGSKNFSLHQHASIIYESAGDREKARIYRRQSVAENQFVDALVHQPSLKNEAAAQSALPIP